MTKVETGKCIHYKINMFWTPPFIIKDILIDKWVKHREKSQNTYSFTLLKIDVWINLTDSSTQWDIEGKCIILNGPNLTTIKLKVIKI